MSKITIDDCLVIRGLKIIKGPGEDEERMDGAGVLSPLPPPIGPLSASAKKAMPRDDVLVPGDRTVH